MIEVFSGTCSNPIIPNPQNSGRDPKLLHREVWPHFFQLQEEARDEGIDLQILSGHRDFFLQQKIWNNKALGKRDLLNDEGIALDFSQLSPQEIIFAIMRWSALPGFSRHHWGTDLDIYDKAALPPNYQIQLIPQEYGPSGVFSKLDNWLDKRLLGGQNFFRPFSRDLGGVAIEPWHISFKPLALEFQDYCQFKNFERIVNHSKDLQLREEVLNNGQVIFKRFIQPALIPPN
jgi:LAS superfamily LD-carboxypeptidase LdcB